MSEPRSGASRRTEARTRAMTELERHERRASGAHFFQSLAIMGSVGWPIVLLATGGALLGRWADDRWDTGIRWTLALLSLGVSVGTWMAFRALKGDE